MSIKPVFINLLKIRLPLSAFMSITHRVSGVALFLLVIPVSLVIFTYLVSSEDSYLEFLAFYQDNFIFRTFVLFCILIFQYHMFAGLRHLLHDFHVLPETLNSSNISSQVALILFLINGFLTASVLL
ncbi:MAG: succinate dehydrogenase, cytochrome b556 subunit [Proteobacteria bacterium]|jgi:succinate dehydrogenase / fumarate reductase cytochrome b subunit|nr:succinate dehydrogenase, cytochrome b556 subunit [Pseudomonadota bacterium]